MAHHYPQCLEPPSAGLAPAKAWVGAEKMKCLTVCVWAWGGRGGDLSLSFFFSLSQISQTQNLSIYHKLKFSHFLDPA